ncbi:hypothetical protein J2787_000224 [Chryseobacterium rhizosphaerae]|uniref:Uncharacterized protein n=1 Tax=Chryseobacterium rhizosphaerae TaxID=395937 RepID=A0AAE4C1T1_9FLAO|nr:hypothetical protein [Chryseobacterium rhizosphaerae]MDR6524854.1 hypothetical protein [Chryseobacterium rhizosphaerae]
MKHIFTIAFIVFFAIKGKGQTENIDSGKYYPAKEHFETQYKKQEHLKYRKTQVRLEKNRAIINVVKSIEFPENIGDRFKLIFENGLLDPMLINGNAHVKISVVNELPLLNTDPQTKRFSFWIFRRNENLKKGTLESILGNNVNPEEYYFELYNEKADNNTSFQKFVEGAELTYIGYGGIII